MTGGEKSQMRRRLFYKSQLLSGIAMCLCISGGILAIHVLVNDPKTQILLTLVLVAIAVLLAFGQIFVTSITFAQVVTPIEKMLSALADWGRLVTNGDASDVQIEKIRDALTKMNLSMGMYAKEWPEEIKSLQTIVIQTLKTMESAWQKAESDAIMIGLGGVCAQVAHDMRSPAATIRVLSKAIVDVETLSERKELSDMMGLSAAKLNRMADELLSYRKSSAVELKPIDLSNIIRDTCRELQVLADGKHVDLVCNIPQDQDFLGDADKMGRVIQNLVGNAIQAVGAQQDGRVEVCMSTQGDHILLNIQDNGPGIPKEHVGKMFQSGFTTKGQNGNGLGLIYCANVVKGHGGQISARNKPEGGAEISIALPIQTAH